MWIPIHAFDGIYEVKRRACPFSHCIEGYSLTQTKAAMEELILLIDRRLRKRAYLSNRDISRSNLQAPQTM